MPAKENSKNAALAKEAVNGYGNEQGKERQGKCLRSQRLQLAQTLEDSRFATGKNREEMVGASSTKW